MFQPPSVARLGNAVETPTLLDVPPLIYI